MGSDKELQAIEEMIRRLNASRSIQKNPAAESHEQETAVQKSPTDKGQERKSAGELRAIEEMIRRLNVPQPVQKSPTDEGQEQKAEPEHQGVSEAELTAVVNMVELLQKENQEEISSQTFEEVFRKFESISERLSKLENDPRPSPKKVSALVREVSEISNRKLEDERIQRELSRIDRRLARLREHTGNIEKALNCCQFALLECGEDVGRCDAVYADEDRDLISYYLNMLLKFPNTKRYEKNSRCLKVLDLLRKNVESSLSQTSDSERKANYLQLLADIVIVLFLRANQREYACSCIISCIDYAFEAAHMDPTAALVYLRRADVIKQLAYDDGYSDELLAAFIDLYGGFAHVYQLIDDTESYERAVRHQKYYEEYFARRKRNKG